jgi:hypothetical protein
VVKLTFDRAKTAVWQHPGVAPAHELVTLGIDGRPADDHSGVIARGEVDLVGIR